jgi:predicted DNA-binding transcriptional regulator YafY
MGVFKGKDDYTVVVDFDAWGADDVRGRRWHSSQELVELGKGMLRVKLRLNSLEEVERWVFGFGRHATVVGPDELRQRLFKVTEELWQRYGGPMVLHDGG